MSIAPAEVATLVERFERNVDAYRRGRYNETQLRREFVDPLFCAFHRQITATDKQIDKLVYDLYGLTEEEIAIVEEATG